MISGSTFFYESETSYLMLGLDKPLDAGDIQAAGGLDKLHEYISNERSYVSAVKEYRINDLAGIMSSNCYTVHIHGE